MSKKSRRVTVKPDEIAIVFSEIGPAIYFGNGLILPEDQEIAAENHPFHIACAGVIWQLLSKEPELLESLMRRYYHLVTKDEMRRPIDETVH